MYTGFFFCRLFVSYVYYDIDKLRLTEKNCPHKTKLKRVLLLRSRAECESCKQASRSRGLHQQKPLTQAFGLAMDFSFCCPFASKLAWSQKKPDSTSLNEGVLLRSRADYLAVLVDLQKDVAYNLNIPFPKPLAWELLFVFVAHLQVNLHGHKNKNPHPAERDRDVFVEVASRVRVLQAGLAIKGAPPTKTPHPSFWLGHGFFFLLPICKQACMVPKKTRFNFVE